VISLRRRAATEPGVLAPGARIDGYRIEGLLGKGGMGAVHEATQLSLGRRVAFKVIDPALATDPTLRERFRREGPLQAGIDHPHILPVYEAGESGDHLFIAMQLVRGHTLKQLIASGALAPDRAFHILADVAAALDAAHAAGLVHRDVKPQNVLVAAGDHAYLADFGLSKAMGDETLTRSGQFLGSVQYVSPEQVRGEPVSAASDIYSFTAMLFECLTGLLPFPRDGEVGVLWAHLSDPPPQPSEIRPELPRELDRVIERGMAKRPEDRYASAGEVVRDTESAVGSEPRPREESDGAPTIPVRPIVTQPSLAVTRTRHRPLLAVVLSVLLVITAAAAGYLVGRQPAAETARAASASNGQVRLTAPDGWARVPNAHRIAGIPLARAVELSTATGRPGLVFGSAAPGATGNGVPQIVRLGALEAYRWTAGSYPVVYAVPTTGRWAVVACLARRTACDAAAGTTTLHGLTPVAAAPERAYGRRLTAIMSALAAARSHAIKALQSASGSAAQARAFGRFSRAYSTAATEISTARAPVAARPANASIRSALAATSHAFGRLESAASRVDGVGYNAAMRAVGRNEDHVRLALKQLKSIGYQLAPSR
jgi:hypothetical protein